MKAEEIVKRLRCRIIETYAGDGVVIESIDPDIDAAANLIEQQAKALSECQRHRAELFDQVNGTPCEQIRHAQEVSELSKTIGQIWLQLGNPTYEELNGRSIHDLIDEIKAENKKLRETLEMAEQSVLFAKANNEWSSEDKEDFDFVIEAIRKLKGE
jgi:hypothetical protein